MTAVGKTIHGTLGFWHGLAALQNAADVLATSGIAPKLRPLASKNVALVGELAKPLHPTQRTIATLVIGATIVEAVAAVAYLRAALGNGRSELGFGLPRTLRRFLSDRRRVHNYELAAKHRATFALLAASYAACGTTLRNDHGLVAGAAGGIGESIVRSLLSGGAAKVFGTSRTRERLDALARASSERASAICTDRRRRRRLRRCTTHRGPGHGPRRRRRRYRDPRARLVDRRSAARHDS